jgi:hypothetical protein
MSGAGAAGMTHGLRPPLPPALLGAARTMAVDRVTGEVVSAMDAAGIPSILLKGPSIARWLYPEGGRTYCDTDLLVRASDYGRAADLLRSMGFAEALGGFHPDERRVIAGHAVPFVRPRRVGDGRGGEVDLHRSLPLLPTPPELLWEACDRLTTSMVVGGRDVRVLDRTGVALQVVVHAVQQGFGLHTGEDLRRLVATPAAPDWEAVAALATRLGIADVLGQGLRRHPAGAVVADRLGLPHVVGAGSPYRYALVGAPPGTATLLRLRDAPTWREKARLARWIVLPSAAKVRYASARADGRSRSLASAYVRWWRYLAAGSVAAVRDATRRRRRSGGTDSPV